MSAKRYGRALVWFRRDLRDYDHAALSQALIDAKQVYCTFVFDTEILDKLDDKADRRVEFIWESVRELKEALRDRGGDLIVLHGSAQVEIPALSSKLGVQAVYTNRDYEPAAITRDQAVADPLRREDIDFETFKDQVIFERGEILTAQGKPYSVFTPYKNAWLKRASEADFAQHPVDKHVSALAAPENAAPMPSLESLGFQRTNLLQLMPTGMTGAEKLFETFQERMGQYHEARDYPAKKGPSYLSVHLRFGTLSIRAAAGQAWYMGGHGAEVWLSELIWREFYFMLLHFHPCLAEGRAYRPEFDGLEYSGSDAHFEAWCQGRTGYPIVDAAMRQLNQTGYMHNRLRMIAASFLVKDLLVDWRKGEAYFARKLIDFDLAANNGGWQWSASTGCDGQPWFRIFNPVTQSEKFDPEGKFIRRYVTELGALHGPEIHAPWKVPPMRLVEAGIALGKTYPEPIVDHATMREKTLALYKNASSSAQAL